MAESLVHFLRVNLPILLIPPAGLLWVVLVGLLLRPFRRRLGGWIAATGLILLYLLSLPAVGGGMIAALEATGPAATDIPPPGAIIVLGADGERTPDPEVTAEPGPLSLQRLAGAAETTRKDGLPVLMSGGSVGHDQPAVADLMGTAFANIFGLKARWLESNSRNTCENAQFSAEILRREGIQSAYVVTHAWHMPRALLSFAHAGFPVIPAPLRGEVNEKNGLSDYLPHTSAWLRSFYGIHEWIGLIAYRLGACPVSTVPAESTPAASSGS